MQIKVSRIDWELTAPFRIAYRTKTHARTVVVEIRDGEHCGRGEAQGVFYHGETPERLLEQLAGVERRVREGITRMQLQELLPAGGARNALDCALWDLAAKRSGRRVWELAGLCAHPLVSAYTLGLDTPEAMAEAATLNSEYWVLKLKLDGKQDVERVAAVRRARPDAVLLVDANQAWNESQLRELTPALADLSVALIEQPLPAGKDRVLADFASPVPLCADETCQTTRSLSEVVGKYQYINIKLDKTGGLTEALQLARSAAQHGLRLMVGCMSGSSLGMAPAFVVGQLCEFVDLDGPLLAKDDVLHAIRYEGSRMSIPEAALWG